MERAQRRTVAGGVQPPQRRLEVIDRESEVVELVPFSERPSDRAVRRVPVQPELVLAVRAAQVRVLPLVPVRLDSRLELHPEDLREEVDRSVEVPDTQARVFEFESHG